MKIKVRVWDTVEERTIQDEEFWSEKWDDVRYGIVSGASSLRWIPMLSMEGADKDKNGNTFYISDIVKNKHGVIGVVDFFISGMIFFTSVARIVSGVSTGIS